MCFVCQLKINHKIKIKRQIKRTATQVPFNPHPQTTPLGVTFVIVAINNVLIVIGLPRRHRRGNCVILTECRT